MKNAFATAKKQGLKLVEEENSLYSESKDNLLPAVGTRVRRGPDWMFGTHDHGGLGTVIGHSLTGMVL